MKVLRSQHTSHPSENVDHNCDENCSSCTNNFNQLLAGIDVNNRAKLDENRSNFSFKRDDFIFKEGMYPSGLFCLSKGKVMITKTDAHGNAIVLNLHKGVTFVGITDYLSNLPYQTNCIALGDVECCLLKYENINRFIETNQAFAKRLLTAISLQNQQTNSRMLAITKKNMNARMADALIELENVFGVDNDGFIDVYLKRNELAQLSNMNMSNAIRHISALQESKIIEINGKRIKILDIPGIEKESEL